MTVYFEIPSRYAESVHYDSTRNCLLDAHGHPLANIPTGLDVPQDVLENTRKLLAEETDNA